MAERTRGEILLDAIEEEVIQRLNPSGEDCPECGGDGYTYDCFEEFACIDPEGGCSECARRCLWCAELKRDRLKAVREEVVKSDDIEIATAWLKQIGRWRDSITPEQIKEQLAAERRKQLPSDHRGGENA